MPDAAVTYRDLSGALRKLHFRKDRKRSAKGYSVLVRPSSDLPIILPVMRPASPVRAAHLAVVRRILRETEPADVDHLDALLHDRDRRGRKGVPVS